MLTPYLLLGVAPDASDEEIRRRFLERVREVTEADEQARLTAAYEQVADLRSRVRTAIFGVLAYGDPELALEALLAARPRARRGPRLSELMAAEDDESASG